MNIAVVGTGHVGGTLGRRWSENGHAVIFGSRSPNSEKVRTLLKHCAAGTRAATPLQAAAECEVVVVALPWGRVQSLAKSRPDWGGKVLIDCVNPLNDNFSGLDLGFTESAAERLAGWAKGARVVKAFNSLSAKTMADPVYQGQAATGFYCGDDAEAKSVVRQLASDLGLEPVDAGPLKIARQLEPLAMLYIHLAVREGWGANCAFKILKR